MADRRFFFFNDMAGVVVFVSPGSLMKTRLAHRNELVFSLFFCSALFFCRLLLLSVVISL